MRKIDGIGPWRCQLKRRATPLRKGLLLALDPLLDADLLDAPRHGRKRRAPERNRKVRMRRSLDPSTSRNGDGAYLALRNAVSRHHFPDDRLVEQFIQGWLFERQHRRLHNILQ